MIRGKFKGGDWMRGTVVFLMAKIQLMITWKRNNSISFGIIDCLRFLFGRQYTYVALLRQELSKREIHVFVVFFGKFQFTMVIFVNFSKLQKKNMVNRNLPKIPQIFPLYWNSGLVVCGERWYITNPVDDWILPFLNTLYYQTVA